MSSAYVFHKWIHEYILTVRVKRNKSTRAEKNSVQGKEKKKRELKLSQWFPSEGLTQTHLGQQNTH
jgi:hypothetical protein